MRPVGNMLSYYNGAFVTNFTWRKGRELASTSALGRTVTYTYNDQGIRTSKTVDGVVHTYTLDGSRILSEEYGGKLYLYFYDESGAIMGFHYRDNTYAKDVFDTYFYEKTYLGDVIGIYDENGTRLAWYMYDAWGNVVHSNCATGYTDLMNANPFRYRGYYYDTDTGLYYLNSRYYNPILGRFINADAVEVVTATPGALTDKNLYAYCDNNPIMRVDHDGRFWKFLNDGLKSIQQEFANLMYGLYEGAERVVDSVVVDVGIGATLGIGAEVDGFSAEAMVRSDFITIRKDSGDMSNFYVGRAEEQFISFEAVCCIFPSGTKVMNDFEGNQINATPVHPEFDFTSTIGGTGPIFTFSIGIDWGYLLGIKTK